MTKQNPQRALYGTNFHGRQCWFCWRRGVLKNGHGCPGVLAEVTDEQITLPDGYRELSDGSYGLHTRGEFRDPEYMWRNDQVRWLRQMADEEPGQVQGREYVLGLADAFERAFEEAGPPSTEPVKTIFRAVIERDAIDKLPIIVRCPSCKSKNIIPSWRSVIAIQKGALLK